MKYLLSIFLSLSILLSFAQGRERFQKGGSKATTTESPDSTKSTSSANTTPAEEGFWDRVNFGGNVGAAFGGGGALVLVSPTMTYRVTERFTAGAGFLYQYSNTEFFTGRGRERIETSVYGPLFLGYYQLFQQLYIGAQFEYLNHDLFFFDPSTGEIFSENQWSPVLFLEAGLTQPLGKNGAVRLGLRYNVLHEPGRSPYNSPWFPVIGFFF